MNPFHYMKQKFLWKLFRKIKEEKSKLFNFNFVFFSDLSWMNPSQYLRPEFPWKLFRKVKEDKKASCSSLKHDFLLSETRCSELFQVFRKYLKNYCTNGQDSSITSNGNILKAFFVIVFMYFPPLLIFFHEENCFQQKPRY